jgi:hypothetical protein
MPIALLVGVASAILFFRAATYERMSPWLWTFASAGLTAIFGFVLPSLLWMIVSQVALFLVMWWYNANRPTQQGN